jgi:hypothetical protein
MASGKQNHTRCREGETIMRLYHNMLINRPRATDDDADAIVKVGFCESPTGAVYFSATPLSSCRLFCGVAVEITETDSKQYRMFADPLDYELHVPVYALPFAIANALPRFRVWPADVDCVES